MTEKKLYKILGINEDADDKQIKAAWKKLTMKYHPDRLRSCSESEKKIGQEKIKDINNAYDILSDSKKKKKYDEFGYMEESGGGFPEGFPGGFPSGPGFDSVFGNMFGGENKSKKKEQNVEPIQVELEVSLLDLFSDKIMEKEISRSILCVPCNGTGSADKKVIRCSACGGNGIVIQRRQVGPVITQSQVTCKECSGSGKGTPKSNKCKQCNGNCVSIEKITIKINIEGGMSGNDVLTINGIGNEYITKTNGIEKGPVYVILREKEHPIFKRGITLNEKQNMANLLITIDINFVESLCGFSKEIKYIDDTILYICETDVIQDGELKKIPSRGMPYKSNKYKIGDLYIKYNVIIPPNLPMETKNKLAELFKYPGIAKPSEGALEVSTVKFNGDNDSCDSEEDDVMNGRHHMFNGQPGPGGAQCVHF